MASCPSPLVFLLVVVLSVCSLTGTGLALAGTGDCNVSSKKSCNEKDMCCWNGSKCATLTASKAINPLACGACGKVCNSVRPTCCNGLCTSTLSDCSNCGQCGIKCTGGMSCVNGACQCPTKQCWNGTKCQKFIGSLTTDRNNCGVCGMQCPKTGASCCCNGNCTDYKTDATNCGVCGNRCAAGYSCCNGRCKDTSRDPINCGACGNQLPAGSTNCCNGSPSNTKSDNNNCGACGNQCSPGSTCCNGSCKNTASDTSNCGACGNQVPSGQKCCGGMPTDTSNDTGNCGVCGKQCDAGWTCSNGTCVDFRTCKQCSLGSTCCGGSCTDLGSDATNCGVCGNQCSPGSTCCGGTCTDFSSDASNCGVCGNQCSQGSTCCGGSCNDLSSDTSNCGACGIVAPSKSTCCNGTPSDTASDVSNCGSCGNQCIGRTGSDCVGDIQCMSCAGEAGCSLYIPAHYRFYDWSTFYELPADSLGYIQFTAIAYIDVHLVLSPEKAFTTPLYEIIVGGGAPWDMNRESQIVHIYGDQPDKADYYLGTKLDNPGNQNELWVSIDRSSRTVQVGKGVKGTATSTTIMSFHDPDFLDNLRFIGFSSWTQPVTYTSMAVYPLPESF